jgi:hypothetical protein
VRRLCAARATVGTIGVVMLAALGPAGCGGTAWSARTGSDGAPATGAAVNAASGPLFQDPQGTYTMTVDPAWTERSGEIVAEIEQWLVGPVEDGFVPNVNVLTQAAPGVDMEEYLRLSSENAPRLVTDFNLVRSKVVTGPTGNLLGEMEYSAQSGTHALHFLAVVSLAHGQAIVATLTTTEATFTTIEARVEPFLVTLRAT